MLNMTGINGDLLNGHPPHTDIPSSGISWQEFCDRHARSAANDFAHHYRAFVLQQQQAAGFNCVGGSGHAALSSEFAQRFVRGFLEQFEVVSTAVNGGGSSGGDVHSVGSGGDYSEPDSPGGPRTRGSGGGHKSFFRRRLSLRGWRLGKFLHKQHSDEVVLNQSSSSRGASPPPSQQHSPAASSSSSSNNNNKHHHRDGNNRQQQHHPHAAAGASQHQQQFAEIKKEGVVSYLTGEDFRGKSKWSKCRLCLARTTGGYMLEFYSPPKTTTTT